MSGASGFGRRRLLVGGSAAGLALFGGAAGQAAARTRGPDPTVRETFDAADAAFNGGNGYKDETNDKDSSGLSGKLAWGEAYVMQGYVLMYLAHRDTHYLDKLVDHADHVLANRDSERGVTDHLGKSHPAWRADHHYTVGSADLAGRDGTPLLAVRTGLFRGDDVSVTVAAEPGGTFRIDVDHAYYDRRTTYTGLSMDEQSPDYAVERVRRGYPNESPGRVLVTVKDLRQGAHGPAEPVAGTFPFVSKPYVHEVHTGQIVLPLVRFARIVAEDPALRPAYGAKADAYLAAARQAVAVHDPEWRVNDEGEGFYVTMAGAPVWHASIANPHNHFLALGRAILQLAVVTGEPVYAERAQQLATTLRNELRADGDAYTWPYWWSRGAAYRGWGVDDPATEYRLAQSAITTAEDTSHGQIEVNFALESYADAARLPGRAPVFTEADLRRLAATFSTNVAATAGDGTPSVHRYVDGSGEVGLPDYERQAAAWAGLTPWDASILTHLRGIFTARDFPSAPSLLYCVAHLNLAAKP